VSNEKVEFAKLVDASATMGANLTLAMGEKKLAAVVVKLSGLCFISEIIERHLLVCCSCVARPEYEGRSYHSGAWCRHVTRGPPPTTPLGGWSPQAPTTAREAKKRPSAAPRCPNQNQKPNKKTTAAHPPAGLAEQVDRHSTGGTAGAAVHPKTTDPRVNLS
jgi:hypothetical protein